jgi:aspartyl-tRNA(Asn)/glutamyl-tRNA(Gln) amidotransferase subunit A
MSGLAVTTIAELAPLVERREVSPIEVTQAALDRITALEPQLNAYITLMPDEALAAARGAEAEIQAGRYRGPLHGVPVGIKDNIAVAGHPTTAGSKALRDYVTDYDATAVTRLREAGAIVVGKTNLHEWAMGGTCTVGYFGGVHNPWDTACTPGGSSGGSAASVSAGGVFAALGTDGWGSIRMPAALCGVVGLKPTQGLVSRWGQLPATSASTDHIGPLCKTVTDTALVLSAIAGHDPRDPTSVRSEPKDYASLLSGGIQGLRVGVLEGYFLDDVDPEVERAVRGAAETLAGLGATLCAATFPLVEHTFMTFTLIPNEALAFHRRLAIEQPDAYYDEEIRHRLIAQNLLLARDAQLAMRVRSLIRARFKGLMAEFDVLVAPTVAVPAFPSGAKEVRYGDRVADLTQPFAEPRLVTRLTFPFNATGNPVVSVPCGFSAKGMPIGLQIVGKHWQDEVVLRAAHAFEQAAGFGYRVPPVAQALAAN